jgi:hypothetical protein
LVLLGFLNRRRGGDRTYGCCSGGFLLPPAAAERSVELHYAVKLIDLGLHQRLLRSIELLFRLQYLEVTGQLGSCLGSSRLLISHEIEVLARQLLVLEYKYINYYYLRIRAKITWLFALNMKGSRLHRLPFHVKLETPGEMIEFEQAGHEVHLIGANAQEPLDEFDQCLLG